MTKDELKTLIADAKNYQDIYNIFSATCRVEDMSDSDGISHSFWFDDKAVLHTWMHMDGSVYFYFQSDWYHDCIEDNPDYYEWDYDMRPS